MYEKGRRPPGVLRSTYSPVDGATRVYLDAELIAMVPDWVSATGVDSLEIDWDVWQKAKIADKADPVLPEDGA